MSVQPVLELRTIEGHDGRIGRLLVLGRGLSRKGDGVRGVAAQIE
jgi:hypothetical protein